MRLGPDITCRFAVLASFLLGACAAPPVTDPFGEQGRVWPEPPETPRIQYVMEFSGPAELGIRPSFWSRFSNLAAGEESLGMVRPMSVAATPGGSLIYVADPEANCVHRFDMEKGRYRCLVAESGEALASPVGLAVLADGSLFATDSGAGAVLHAGPRDDALVPLPLTPPPVQPTGIGAEPGGDIFVTSTGTHSVRRYGPDGVLKREYGERGNQPDQMNFPTYLWLSESELLVSDTMNFRIQRIDPENGVLGVFGKAGDASGSLARPKGVAMDRHGHIYVVDGVHHALHIFDRDGQLLLSLGQQGSGPGEFWLPSGVFVTGDDLVFVADSYNRRVQVFRYLEGQP